MFKGNIINVNFDMVKKALNDCSEPKILLMNEATLLIFMEVLTNHPDIEIKETEYQQICYFCNVPINMSPILEFGEVIVK